MMNGAGGSAAKTIEVKGEGVDVKVETHSPTGDSNAKAPKVTEEDSGIHHKVKVKTDGIDVEVDQEDKDLTPPYKHDRHIASILEEDGPVAVLAEIKDRFVALPISEFAAVSLAGTYSTAAFILAAYDRYHDTGYADKVSSTAVSFAAIITYFSLKETRNESPAWKRYSAYSANIAILASVVLSILKTTNVIDGASVLPDLFLSLATSILPLVFWPPTTEVTTGAGKIAQRASIGLGTVASLGMLVSTIIELAIKDRSGFEGTKAVNKLASALTTLFFAANGAFECIRKSDWSSWKLFYECLRKFDFSVLSRTDDTKIGWPWWKQVTDLGSFALAITSFICQTGNVTGKTDVSTNVLAMLGNTTLPLWAFGMVIASLRHVLIEPIKIDETRLKIAVTDIREDVDLEGHVIKQKKKLTVDITKTVAIAAGLQSPGTQGTTSTRATASTRKTRITAVTETEVEQSVTVSQGGCCSTFLNMLGSLCGCGTRRRQRETEQAAEGDWASSARAHLLPDTARSTGVQSITSGGVV